MVWLPDSEQILNLCLVVLTEFTNVTDGRTDIQIPRDGIGRTCIALHGENYAYVVPPIRSMLKVYGHHFFSSWLAACHLLAAMSLGVTKCGVKPLNDVPIG